MCRRFFSRYVIVIDWLRGRKLQEMFDDNDDDDDDHDCFHFTEFTLWNRKRPEIRRTVFISFPPGFMAKQIVSM